jgi:hypothetical protein
VELEKQTMTNLAKNHNKNRLTNYMEELAGEVLEDLISKSKESFSPNAIQDIKALALNRLWPMYTTTEAGKDYLRKVVEADKIEKDVLREVRTAIDIVKSNPR